MPNDARRHRRARGAVETGVAWGLQQERLHRRGLSAAAAARRSVELLERAIDARPRERDGRGLTRELGARDGIALLERQRIRRRRASRLREATGEPGIAGVDDQHERGAGAILIGEVRERARELDERARIGANRRARLGRLHEQRDGLGAADGGRALDPANALVGIRSNAGARETYSVPTCARRLPGTVGVGAAAPRAAAADGRFGDVGAAARTLRARTWSPRGRRAPRAIALSWSVGAGGGGAGTVGAVRRAGRRSRRLGSDGRAASGALRRARRGPGAAHDVSTRNAMPVSACGFCFTASHDTDSATPSRCEYEASTRTMAKTRASASICAALGLPPGGRTPTASVQSRWRLSSSGERADRGNARGVDVGRVGGAGDLDRRRDADRTALVVDHDERLAALVGAAVVVGDAVPRLGDVGALVDVVLERVAVAIGVRGSRCATDRSTARRRRSGTRRPCRRCRRCRCPDRGSRPRPGSRPCPRAASGHLSSCVGDAVAVAVLRGAAVRARIARSRRPCPSGTRRPRPRRRRRRRRRSGSRSSSDRSTASPFTLGQASSLSMMPSSSLSISGQPSASSKPSLSSGISGQPSTSSRTPS